MPRTCTPPLLAASTVVLPGCRAGITHTTMLDVFHVPCSVVVPPMRHTTPPVLTNPCPITVTEVPPASGPKLGSTRSTTPSRTYRNTCPSCVRSAPSLPVTSTATSPSAPAGAMQLSKLELATSALVSSLMCGPNMQIMRPCSNPLPCTSMTAPPCTLPMLGCTDSTLIASMYSNRPKSSPSVMPASLSPASLSCTVPGVSFPGVLQTSTPLVSAARA